MVMPWLNLMRNARKVEAGSVFIGFTVLLQNKTDTCLCVCVCVQNGTESSCIKKFATTPYCVVI